MIPDAEHLIEDDLSFLEIATYRVDDELCKQLISFWNTLLVLVICVLVVVWITYRSSIQHFYFPKTEHFPNEFSPDNKSIPQDSSPRLTSRASLE